MHKNYGDFFMYTDFFYYNQMRDQENETLIKNLEKQEQVAFKNNMRVSGKVIHEFKENLPKLKDSSSEQKILDSMLEAHLKDENEK